MLYNHFTTKLVGLQEIILKCGKNSDFEFLLGVGMGNAVCIATGYSII